MRPATGEETPARGGGIGLRNVNFRIKLSCGPAWGLAVDSAPGRGTVVTVRLPAESGPGREGALPEGRRPRLPGSQD